MHSRNTIVSGVSLYGKHRVTLRVEKEWRQGDLTYVWGDRVRPRTFQRIPNIRRQTYLFDGQPRTEQEPTQPQEGVTCP